MESKSILIGPANLDPSANPKIIASSWKARCMSVASASFCAVDVSFDRLDDRVVVRKVRHCAAHWMPLLIYEPLKPVTIKSVRA